MVFGGLQKLTLLDFPGTVSCILFTKGCNFACPFCHNAALVKSDNLPEYTEDEIFDFLKKRKGILDGVCITGGEPLIHPSLPDFIRKVRAIGYKVKLDTNGAFPERLKELMDENLLDYVAMDIKNTFSKYPETSGCENVNISDIEKSIDLLLYSNVPYEFRTTVTKELHTTEDIAFIANRIKGAQKYFLQNFTDSGDILKEGMHSVDNPTLEKMVCKAQYFVPAAKFR
ncbi:MAG: anaerobic ribonucleoside-triphosphate reductase activating protein [Clostridia bacterium]|nr:anaerobic ribonucleoside-triphosphate reductase activating protein [Clostridia bacterium]